MAIAGLTDQGSGRKRLSPDVVKARENAFERMMDRIDEAHKAQKAPLYRLTGFVILDSGDPKIGHIRIPPVWIEPQTHIHKPQEVGWPGIPNSMMVPINETAEGIYAEYLKWIGEDAAHTPRVDRVTHGGVVVMQQNSGPAPGPARTPTGEALGGVQIMRDGRLGAPSRQLNVLGTVAEPAREQVA